MSTRYVIACDFGTSGVKASLVDTEGTICAAAMETYPLYTPEESWAEQDPEDYWRAVCTAIRSVMHKSAADAADVLGLAFCSQWKGIIPIDRDGNVLHRSITWLDARGGEQAHRMNRLLQLNHYKEKLFGVKPSSRLNAALGREVLCGADYWPKLAWFRENLPDIYEKTAVILECNSFVKWRATGEMAVDMTNHFTKSFSKVSQGVYDLFLKLGRVDPVLFPKLVLPTDRVGGLTDEAAARMGLVPGTPVFGGCGDIPAIAIGSGTAGLGDTHAYFGSSGWLGSIVSTQEGFLSTSPFTREQDILLFGFQAIGLSFDWTLRQLYHREYEELGDGIYAYLAEELRDIPAGSKGLMAAHWIYGERPPFFSDKARGLFIGLGSQHDRRYMVNAMMESICYSMRLSLDALQKGTRRSIPSLNAVGGCTADDRWMQMLSDVLEIPVNVPDNTRHAGTVGTAYCALIGLGLCRDFEEAKSRIRMTKTFTPNPANFAVYRRMTGAYRKLYPRMRETFRDIAEP